MVRQNNSKPKLADKVGSIWYKSFDSIKRKNSDLSEKSEKNLVGLKRDANDKLKSKSVSISDKSGQRIE